MTAGVGGRCRRLEIWLVRRGNDGFVFPGVEIEYVFSANNFHPFLCGALISYCRRPGHHKDAFIFHCENKLQAFASVCEIGSCVGSSGIFSLMLRATAALGLFVIDQPIAFHYVQCRAVRGAVHIDHCERPIGFDPDRVDHQRVAFIMPNRIPYHDGVTCVGCGWFRRTWRTS